jgi:hypothetical protein
VRYQRTEAGLSQALETLRAARETAIAQRRNVEVRFIHPNVIQLVRQDVPVGTTVLRTVHLEGGLQFLQEPGAGDTPDRFGAGSAIAFGPSPSRMFTSEGTLVDAAGDVLNGTLFLADPSRPNSARAITVFGVTAFVRTWKWNGRAWVD